MTSNIVKNGLIALLVPLPSIFFYASFQQHISSPSLSVSLPWRWCLDHPFLLANSLFFLNVNCLFWVIGIIQSNHWMIDLYWTIIPVMLVHYYATHPLAQFDQLRSRVVILLTWIWSLRLTHSYLRRERWVLGSRQDWRFTDMAKQYGKQWTWVSFFIVYLSQQVLLVGVCLPLYVIHSMDKPWSIWDLVAAIVCLTGITIAYFADTQLHDFVARNTKLMELGMPTVAVLEEGLWKHSRHPNYFGEQLWWWGLVIFACNLGQRWVMLGAVVNSLCFVHVTKLVEDRMVREEKRAEAYHLYCKRTPLWVPWSLMIPRFLNSSKDKPA